MFNIRSNDKEKQSLCFQGDDDANRSTLFYVDAEKTISFWSPTSSLSKAISANLRHLNGNTTATTSPSDNIIYSAYNNSNNTTIDKSRDSSSGGDGIIEKSKDDKLMENFVARHLNFINSISVSELLSSSSSSLCGDIDNYYQNKEHNDTGNQNPAHDSFTNLPPKGTKRSNDKERKKDYFTTSTTTASTTTSTSCSRTKSSVAANSSSSSTVPANLNHVSPNFVSINIIKKYLEAQKTTASTSTKTNSPSATTAATTTTAATATVTHLPLRTSNYKCEICDQLFLFDKRKIDAHNKKFHTTCKICGKSCHSFSHYKQHILTHSEERNFICDVCGMTFKNSSSLSTHMTNRHCESVFRTCKLCKKEFKRRRNLISHCCVRKPKERKFKCETCKMAFTSKDILNQHTRIHTGIFPHTCPICSKGFHVPCVLQKHLLKAHQTITTTK